jgi:ribose 5-phosphate isomerase B
MKIGIASDHGGFNLKELVIEHLSNAGHELVDFGAFKMETTDDYPDYVYPLASSIANGQLEKGIAICGSGVGACIAANKVHGVRACLITDQFSAHQGVEDDDMNLICLGGRITGAALALEIVDKFLLASFSGAPRHQRRVDKVKAIELGKFPV